MSPLKKPKEVSKKQPIGILSPPLFSLPNRNEGEPWDHYLWRRGCWRKFIDKNTRVEPLISSAWD